MTANWIDFAVLTVMALSVFFGLWRGVLRAGFGILALVVGFYAAQDYAHLLFPYMRDILGKSPLARPLSYAVFFVGGLFFVHIASALILRVLRKMDFGGLDVLGGALFGVLRGVAFCAVLLLLFSAVGIGKTAVWKESATVPYVGGALRYAMNFPPLANYRQWLEFDERNRPLIVDSGLLLAAEAEAEAAKKVEDAAAVPAASEGLETQPTSLEKIEGIQEFLSQSVDAASGEGDLESLSPEDLKKLQENLPPDDATNKDE